MNSQPPADENPGSAVRDAEARDCPLNRELASSTPDLEDPRVIAAVQEYLAALERGDTLSQSTFVQRHPDIAGALTICLAGLEFVHQAASGLHASALQQPIAAAAAHTEATAGTPLGDFQILRELGRGGMGVVYEAEQLSLGRRVALKVLPFAAALDPKQLQRFKNEAQAAAHLHHTSIVPVFGVGCERGVHYFAMQYIDGQTLAQVIAKLRQQSGLETRSTSQLLSQAAQDFVASRSEPVNRAESAGCPTTPSLSHKPIPVPVGDTGAPAGLSTNRSIASVAYMRTVANLGMQAAEALEHAHQRGIVHRDVKPANLLVDGHGHLWITDFGLAHYQSQAGLTMTGDLVGTLRYMSPEQALAKRGAIDARTDVYSLGITLYEVLTLEPAYQGRDREELLLQIAFEEPRLPRRVNPALPADLETILLKAMAKEPARRYPSAGALADDLRRFLSGEPIQARPMGAWARAWSWARRRPALAALLLVSGLAQLLVVGGAVGLWFHGQLQAEFAKTQHAFALTQQAKEAEQKQREVAEAARTKAEEAKQQAERYRYYHHIARAHADLRDGNVAEAKQLLDACPPEQRRWEWQYLKRLCHAELFSLEGHTDWIWRVAFSPDGRQLAFAGNSTIVRVWDMTTGQLQGTLVGHTEQVECVSFSPDGTQLASGSIRDGTVRIWDVLTKKQLRSFPIKLSNWSNLAYSPDGTRLAGISGETLVSSQVKLWDAKTGREVLTIPHSSRAARAVAFSPDGTKLAWGAWDRSVKVWDFETSQLLYTFTGHQDWVAGLAFSPNGTRLASASFDRTVKVWDMTPGRRGEVLAPLRTLIGHSSVVHDVVFSPDGSHIASASFDRSVRIWNALTGEETLTLTGHTGGINYLAFSPDGTRVSSAGRDKTVKVWDPTASQRVYSVQGQPEVLVLWNVAFSPNGTRLASVASDKTVRILDTTTRQEIRTLNADGDRSIDLKSYGQVAFSPDGNRLAEVSQARADHTVKIWDVASGQLMYTLAGHTKDVVGVTFSSDGAPLASASEDHTIRIWEVAKGQEFRTLTGHTDTVKSIAFSPDGSRLASGSHDATVRVWDTATGQLIHILKGHDGLVWSVVYSPDASRLASAGSDETVRIWDVRNGQKLLTLRGHTDPIHGAVFSPDGTRLASASWDQTVRIWDTRTGQEVLTLQCPTGKVSSVSFSPDGTQLAAAGLGTTPVIWDARPRTPEAVVEREAIGLLEHLFTKPLRKADVLAYLRTSPTVRPPVRQKALALIDRYREERNWERYHQAARHLVQQPYLNAFQYHFAWRQAQAACQLAPEPSACWKTLGMAQYRLGKYREAACTLAGAETAPNATPAELAFWAMAQHHLGQKEQAQAALARLRQSVQQAEWIKDDGAQGFLREAELLLGGKH